MHVHSANITPSWARDFRRYEAHLDGVASRIRLDIQLDAHGAPEQAQVTVEPVSLLCHPDVVAWVQSALSQALPSSTVGSAASAP